MQPCNCLGIEITWACNLNCEHCFFKRFAEIRTNRHSLFEDIMREVRAGKDRGCNRVTIEGKGEPMMHPQINDIIAGITELGMMSNIITNATFPISQYQQLFDLGLNHLQLSIHGLDKTADIIMNHNGAGMKQYLLIEWLMARKLPYRTNTTLQKLNYKDLPQIIMRLISGSAFHIALLGFLPHYHWKKHINDVAVHPGELRPYIEAAAELLIESNRYFTIRYHPFCHLLPKYWKYVVNARYVLYDPWEWDYGHYNPDWRKVWPFALAMGESVAMQINPCSECRMRVFCGGWNRFYADAFEGADLKPIKEIPKEYIKTYGYAEYLHDLNPANRLKGYCTDGKPAE